MESAGPRNNPSLGLPSPAHLFKVVIYVKLVSARAAHFFWKVYIGRKLDAQCLFFDIFDYRDIRAGHVQNLDAGRDDFEKL